MAGSVNKVILVGNLGKDPEIRRTQDGRPIANLSVATADTSPVATERPEAPAKVVTKVPTKAPVAEARHGRPERSASWIIEAATSTWPSIGRRRWPGATTAPPCRLASSRWRRRWRRTRPRSMPS